MLISIKCRSISLPTYLPCQQYLERLSEPLLRIHTHWIPTEAFDKKKIFFFGSLINTYSGGSIYHTLDLEVAPFSFFFLFFLGGGGYAAQTVPVKQEYHAKAL